MKKILFILCLQLFFGCSSSSKDNTESDEDNLAMLEEIAYKKSYINSLSKNIGTYGDLPLPDNFPELRVHERLIEILPYLPQFEYIWKESLSVEDYYQNTFTELRMSDSEIYIKLRDNGGASYFYVYPNMKIIKKGKKDQSIAIAKYEHWDMKSTPTNTSKLWIYQAGEEWIESDLVDIQFPTYQDFQSEHYDYIDLLSKDMVYMEYVVSPNANSFSIVPEPVMEKNCEDENSKECLSQRSINAIPLEYHYDSTSHSFLPEYPLWANSKNEVFRTFRNFESAYFDKDSTNMEGLFTKKVLIYLELIKKSVLIHNIRHRNDSEIVQERLINPYAEFINENKIKINYEYEVENINQAIDTTSKQMTFELINEDWKISKITNNTTPLAKAKLNSAPKKYLNNGYYHFECDNWSLKEGSKYFKPTKYGTRVSFTLKNNKLDHRGGIEVTTPDSIKTQYVIFEALLNDSILILSVAKPWDARETTMIQQAKSGKFEELKFYVTNQGLIPFEVGNTKIVIGKFINHY
mgnify:CR=1 FL=1